MDLDSCTHQCLPRKAEWLDSERHKLRHLENKHHSRLKVELKLLLGWTGVGKWIQFSAGWASAEALQGTLLAPLTAGCSCASWETRSFFSFSFIYFFKLIIIDCNFPPGSTSWDVDTLTPSPGLAEVPTAFAISPAWVVLSVWGQVDRQWFLCLGSGFPASTRVCTMCEFCRPCFGAGVVQGWVIKLLQLHNSLLIVLVNTTCFYRMGTGMFGLLTLYSRHSEH